jgi:hypothetical protein
LVLPLTLTEYTVLYDLPMESCSDSESSLALKIILASQSGHHITEILLKVSLNTIISLSLTLSQSTRCGEIFQLTISLFFKIAYNKQPNSSCQRVIQCSKIKTGLCCLNFGLVCYNYNFGLVCYNYHVLVIILIWFAITIMY